MAGILAVIAFALAAVFALIGPGGYAWTHPVFLTALGLAFLALHLLGAGAGWPPWRRG